MSAKIVSFDANSLLKLLVHYTDGRGLPLNSELKAAGVHPMLQRYIGLWIESDEWDSDEPLHLRYEGKHTLRWQKSDAEPGAQPEWLEQNETPRKQ